MSQMSFQEKIAHVKKQYEGKTYDDFGEVCNQGSLLFEIMYEAQVWVKMFHQDLFSQEEVIKIYDKVSWATSMALHNLMNFKRGSVQQLTLDFIDDFQSIKNSVEEEIKKRKGEKYSHFHTFEKEWEKATTINRMIENEDEIYMRIKYETDDNGWKSEWYTQICNVYVIENGKLSVIGINGEEYEVESDETFMPLRKQVYQDKEGKTIEIMHFEEVILID